MRKVLFVVGILATLMPGPALAFSTDYHRWDGNPAQVAVTVEASIPGAWIAPIARAMGSWNAAGVKFRFTAGSADHNIALKNVWWNGNAVAVTYVREMWGTRITDKDTDFNSRYPFDIDGRASTYDVQDVITHELGHWLHLNDLGSNSDYWKTMYVYSYLGSTYRRSLDQDDINGIKSLYGW